MASPRDVGGDAEIAPTLLATVVNPAGLILAKMVPGGRAEAFASAGLGAGPSWHAFAIDATGVAFSTSSTGVVGDQRLRIVPDARARLDHDLSWMPAEFHELTGEPSSLCPRGTLRRVVAELAADDLEASVGHEIEFVLVAPDGAALPAHDWTPYGAAGLLGQEEFVRDLIADLGTAGVEVEQVHPEHARLQFEVSLAPADPVTAADRLVLARIVIGRVARRHGVRAALSPKPFADEAGCGAHQHISLRRGGSPLFSDGSGAAGMTADGEHAVAGILEALPELQGVLCGSVVSCLRTRPGQWAGAYACWGVENREAAVRLVRAETAGGAGRDANIEVKAVDPSANVYLATAAVLGAAARGIARRAELPPEVAVDPVECPPERRGARLASDQRTIVDRLDSSEAVREILGDEIVDAVVAVRRYEVTRFPDHTPEFIAERFRLAWTV